MVAAETAELVRRLAGGDPAALTELYDRLAGLVHGLALRVLQEEEGLKISSARVSASALLGIESTKIVVHGLHDIGAAIAMRGGGLG